MRAIWEAPIQHAKSPSQKCTRKKNPTHILSLSPSISSPPQSVLTPPPSLLPWPQSTHIIHHHHRGRTNAQTSPAHPSPLALAASPLYPPSTRLPHYTAE